MHFPEDDAESASAAASREAAERTPPNNNMSDPDARLEFQQMGRANAILRDERQRAHYDRLLAIALREEQHMNQEQHLNQEKRLRFVIAG